MATAERVMGDRLAAGCRRRGLEFNASGLHNKYIYIYIYVYVYMSYDMYTTKCIIILKIRLQFYDLECWIQDLRFGTVLSLRLRLCLCLGMFACRRCLGFPCKPSYLRKATASGP